MLLRGALFQFRDSIGIGIRHGGGDAAGRRYYRRGDDGLRGAGGHVVRFDDHKPLAYGKQGWDNPFFIAYAPGVALKV